MNPRLERKAHDSSRRFMCGEYEVNKPRGLAARHAMDSRLKVGRETVYLQCDL